MPEINQTISHYRIVEKIGQGGMGEVYLADDTNLDRKVALKFLPEAFTSDPERMARFEREAKLLASLNHPNIAGIYGLEQADGNRFLVLEYVEGETLQARLSKGALPLEDALELCRQIAEGLEAAHEKGVIHRDLKPANVMITDEENVKILDFGLAKALSDETQSIDSSQSPTLTEAMTRPGVILGTAAYMSPEQAKGKSVDKRADIWAFGCILYECLTGKKVFEGETVTETLAAVIRGEPGWDTLPATVSPGIRTLLRRCLYKDRHNRLPHIGSARIEIEEADISVLSTPTVPLKRSGRERIVWTVAALFAITTIFFGWKSLRQDKLTVTAPSLRLELSLPDQLQVLQTSELSPDGSSLAFLKRSEDISQLAIVNLETREVTTVSETNGAEYPFWSPDSQSIGFRSFPHEKLKIVNIAGGMPRELPTGSLPIKGGGSWNEDDTIIFSSSDGIYKINQSSPTPQQVTSVDQSRGEASHICPRFLPDNRRFLYTITNSNDNSPSIYVTSIDGDTPQLVMEGSGAIYLSGYLLYVQEGRLCACTCDPESLAPTGKSIEIARGVSMSSWRGPAFSAVSSGLVVYSSSGYRQKSQFIEYDREGNQLRVIGDAGRYTNPALSPTQPYLLFGRENESTISGEINLFRLNLDSSVMSPFTFGNYENDPVWSPDGSQVVFAVHRGDHQGLYIMDAIPGGKGKQVLESEVVVYPDDWSPDGKSIIYGRVDPKTRRDLWILPLPDGEPSPWLQDSGIDDMGVFSPDGRWIAYSSSSDTGQLEVYIEPLDRSGYKWRVSSEGGRQPRWRRSDGKELFFVSSDGTALYSSLITYNPLPESSTPKKLFDVNLPEMTQSQWVVTKDGRRFIVQTLTEENVDRLSVVTNWRALVQ